MQPKIKCGRSWLVYTHAWAQVLANLNRAFIGRIPAATGHTAAELAPARDQAVVCSAGPTTLAGRSHQDSTEVCVNRERRHLPLASRGWLRTPGEGTQGRGMPPSKLRSRLRTIAPSACRYAGGDKVVARALLVKPRSAGDDETWTILVPNFPVSRPKTAPSSPSPRRRRWQWRRCWRVSPRESKATRGARKTRTLPGCCSKISAPVHSALSGLETVVNASFTCSPSSPTSRERERRLARTWLFSGGESSTILKRSHWSPGHFVQFRLTAPGEYCGQVCVGDVEVAHYRRDYATVATAA